MTGSTETDKTPVPPGAWRALIVLTCVYTLHYIDRSIIGILIEPLKAEFGLSDGQLGFLTGLAYGGLYAIAGLILGYFIDRMNRRNLLALLLFCWSAATALCGMATNFWTLLAARCAVGVAESGASPAAMSIISDIFPRRRRSTAMGVFWSSTTLGLALAATVGSWVASEYGWRTAFFVAGAPGLLMMLILLAWVREPRRGALDPTPKGTEAAPTLAEAWRALSRNRVYVLGLLAMVCNSAGSAGLLIWVPSFFLRAHGLTLVQAGLVMSVAAVTMGSIGAVVGGAVADRLTRRSGLAGLALTPAGSALLSGGAGIFMLLAATPWAAILCWMLWELCFRGYFGPGNNLLLTSTEPRMRGMAASASQASANFLGFGLGPTIIGVLSDRIGGPHALQWGMGAVLVFPMIAATLFLLASREAARLARTNLIGAAQPSPALTARL